MLPAIFDASGRGDISVHCLADNDGFQHQLRAAATAAAPATVVTVAVTAATVATVTIGALTAAPVGIVTSR